MNVSRINYDNTNSIDMFLIRFSFIYTFLFLFSTSVSFSQDVPINKDLEEEKVVIISAYQPQLANAEKVGVNPSGSDIPNTEKSANADGLQGVSPYIVDPNFLELELEAPEMRAVALPKGNESNTGVLEKNYNFWLKAGFGNYRTPLLNVSVNTGDRIANGIYGIDLNHISSNAGNGKAFQQHGVLLFGEQKTEKFRFNVDGTYDYDRYHYYGFNKDEFELSADEIRINYQNIGLGLSFDNKHQTLTDYEFEVGLNGNYIFTNLAAKEFTGDFNAGLFRRWQNGLKIGSDVQISYTNNTDSLTNETDSFENTVVSIIPKVAYKWAWGRADVGASALFDNANFSVFPNLYVQFDAVRNVLGIYGGLEKKIQKNTLKSLSDENPFLNHTINFDNSLITSGYVGVTANIASFLTLDVRGVYEQTKNQALFVNEIDGVWGDDKEFTVEYEPKMNAFGGEAELSLFVNKISQLSAKFSYRKYDLELNDRPWLIPEFTTQIKFKVNPIEKLELETNLFMYAKRYAKQYTNDPTVTRTVRRNAIFDLNFSAEYSITENFGLFLNANNLTLSKYQRYLYYNSYGLNFVGGIKARF